MLAINGTHNHIHILLGVSPDIKISDLVRDVKSDSSLFINENKLSKFKFYWQEGYGVFSYSRDQRDLVIKYIMSQEEHHKKRTFREEYLELLKQFDIDYNVKYLFDFFEE
jgi:REP element-mobilizing transposase RayT